MLSAAGQDVGLDASAGAAATAVRCISSSVSRSSLRKGSCPVSISKKRTPSA